MDNFQWRGESAGKRRDGTQRSPSAALSHSGYGDYVWFEFKKDSWINGRYTTRGQAIPTALKMKLKENDKNTLLFRDTRPYDGQNDYMTA